MSDPSKSPAARKRATPTKTGSPSVKRRTTRESSGAVVVSTEPAHPRPRHRMARHVPASGPTITFPMTGWSVTLPHQKEWPWLAGVAVVAALDVIDWPVALLLGIGHTIVTNSRNQQLRELADGMDSAL